MRSVALLVVLSAVSPAHAKEKATRAPSSVACEKSVAQIATVLLQTSDKLAELRAQHLVEIRQAPTCTTVRNGVTEYVFVVDTCGNCLPHQATMTVTEDLTPTYHDGAPVYTTVVNQTN